MGNMRNGIWHERSYATYVPLYIFHIHFRAFICPMAVYPMSCYMNKTWTLHNSSKCLSHQVLANLDMEEETLYTHSQAINHPHGVSCFSFVCRLPFKSSQIFETFLFTISLRYGKDKYLLSFGIVNSINDKTLRKRKGLPAFIK